MSEYLIVKLCSYVNADGSVTQQRQPGSIVELPDNVAAELGDAVEKLGATPAPKTAEPEQPTTDEPAPEQAKEEPQERPRASSRRRTTPDEGADG